jgi:ABC-type uncharacterized transport system substrate-binding protein
MQFDHLKRREFVALLGVSAVAWPFVAYAAASRPRVGVLTLLSPRDERGRIAAFVAGMRERGYVPGQTLNIDYRYAEGDNERLPPLARELVTLAPGVIFAGEPSAARAVKALAPNLPIVCPILGDHLPDLFASYARPGGSVTGMASIVEGVNAKLVELASDALPGPFILDFKLCYFQIAMAVAHLNAVLTFDLCFFLSRGTLESIRVLAKESQPIHSIQEIAKSVSATMPLKCG